jgi:signal transduction histidine kinase/ligand-binding sensor domain-containing protein
MSHAGIVWLKYLKTILILSLLFDRGVAGQNGIQIDHLQYEAGLSSNNISQIFKDRHGFLWFATLEGLYKFDGYSFTPFENIPGDDRTISNSDVSSICEYKGELWVGTWGGGVNKFDGVNRFSHFKNDPNDTASLSEDRIQFMHCTRSGELLIATFTGLDIYNNSRNSFDHLLRKTRIMKITEDDSGNLYLSTLTGLIVIEKGTRKLIKYLLPSNMEQAIYDVCIDHNGTFWIGKQKGVCRFDPAAGRFTELDSNEKLKNKLSGELIYNIFEDSYNNLWFGTHEQGIFKLDRNDNSILNFNSKSPNPRSRIDNNIRFIMEDNSRVLWIATDGGGVYKTDLKPPKFINHFQMSKNSGDTGELSARAISEDASGKIWIGMGTGIKLYNLNKGKIKLVNSLNPGNSKSSWIRTMCAGPNGNLLIGPYRYGLIIYDPVHNKFIESGKIQILVKAVKAREIRKIIKDKDGIIWCATDDGLFEYDEMKGTVTKFKKTDDPNFFVNTYLTTVFEDREGFIWCGSYSNELVRFDKSTKKFVHFGSRENGNKNLLNSFITTITDDKKYIWAGTAYGLNRIDKTTFDVRKYYKTDGLPGNRVNGLLTDNQDNIWIAGDDGILKLNESEKISEKFDKHDGIINTSFIGRICFKSKSGEMFFGNNEGFISFFPGKIERNKTVPPIVLTKLKIYGREKYFDKDLSSITDIDLSYKENFIRFEFSALDYTATQNNQYKYILEGYDSDWISAGNAHSADYPNLSSGRYLFRVIGSNGDGIWNERGIAVRLNIIPPFWQTWLFYTVVGLLLTTGIAGGIKAKTAGIEKRRKELENLNRQLRIENLERKKAESEMRDAKERAENSERLKSEFLAQVSHEIRTPLNNILSFSNLIQQDGSFDQTGDIKDYFSVIDRSGKRLIRTVDLIINMSELQTGLLECEFKIFDLFEEIIHKKYNEYLSTARENNLSFEITKDAGGYPIYADQNTVEQIFENLINNAFKYTAQGGVKIRLLRETLGSIAVEIIDTGIGISPEYISNLFKPFTQEEGGYKRKYEGNGLGLALTKKYAEMNNAHIRVSSEKGAGSVFSVSFNLASF